MALERDQVSDPWGKCLRTPMGSFSHAGLPSEQCLPKSWPLWCPSSGIPAAFRVSLAETIDGLTPVDASGEASLHTQETTFYLPSNTET